MHEQRGAANTANLRCPSQGARPLDVAVETADVRGSGLRSMLGGPIENVTRPATLLSCAEVRLPLVFSPTDSTADAPSPPNQSLVTNSSLRKVFVATRSTIHLTAASCTRLTRVVRCVDWLCSREDDGRAAEELARLTIRPATSVTHRHARS